MLSLSFLLSIRTNTAAAEAHAAQGPVARTAKADTNGETELAGSSTSTANRSERVLTFQLVAAGVAAVLWLVVWIWTILYVILKREHLTTSGWTLLRVFTLVCAALFGILIAGEGIARWKASGPTFSFLIYGTGGFAAMLILNFILPKYLQTPEKPAENGQAPESPAIVDGTLHATAASDKVERPAIFPLTGSRPTMKRMSKSSTQRKSRQVYERIFADEQFVDEHLNQFVAVGPDGLIDSAETEAALKEKVAPKIAGKLDWDDLMVRHIEVDIVKNFDFGGPAIIKLASAGGRGR